MAVREAKPYEDKALEKLYKQMCPDEPVKVLPERVQRFLDSERDYLLVYELDNEIVGTLTVNICLNAELGELYYAIFENIVVLEEYRGKGIGTELLQYGESIARRFNSEKIMLLSSVERQNAHEFFRKLGFNDSIVKGFKKYL